METLKLNNTPVRTSRNFGINNIELKDIELPENLKEFKNVEIVNEGCSLEKSVSNKKLVYGNGEILEENILKNANRYCRPSYQKEAMEKMIKEMERERTLEIVH